DTADTQSAHERGKQKPERDRGRTDGELQELIPGGLVNERRAPAGREEQQDDTQVAATIRRGLHWLVHRFVRGYLNPMLDETMTRRRALLALSTAAAAAAAPADPPEITPAVVERNDAAAERYLRSQTTEAGRWRGSVPD